MGDKVPAGVKTFPKVLLVVISIVLSLGLAEGVLWIADFSYPLYPEKIEFGYPDPVRMGQQFVQDKDLFWVRPTYREKLEKAAGERPGLALMGCSCTELGKYDKYLEEIIDRNQPDNRFGFVNLAVSGWSSHQGLAQLKRDVLSIKPKVVTIFFGWNDHWKGFGIEDKDIAGLNDSFLYRLRNVRIIQLINKTYLAIFGGFEKSQFPERVSLSDYRFNLIQMVRIAKENDIVPVLLTAPTSHKKGSEPEYLTRRWLTRLEDLIPLHQSYIQVVREVAAKEDALLLDLAKIFEDLPAEAVEKSFFLRDGIHFQDAGGEMVARYLYDFLLKNDLLQRLIQ